MQTRAVEGAYPLRMGERTWGPFALFGNCASAAVATWCFIIGGYVSYYLPAGKGSVVMLAGILLGMFLIFLACVPMGTRYGLEAVRSTKPQLGARGSYFTLALLFFSTLGWNTLLVIFCGRAGAEILIASGLLPEAARGATQIGVGLVALVVVWLLLRGGPAALRNIGPIVAISVLLLALFIIGLIINQLGWSAIADAEPSFASGDDLLDYTIGVELLIATALSWWPYVGAMVRFSPSTRSSMFPVLAGLGIAVAVVSFIGLYSGLAVPESGGDPTTYLVELGGLTFGLPALAFIMLANIGTTMVGAYAAALAFKQDPTIDRKLPWNVATGLALGATALVLIFLSTPFFDNFGTFLAFSGVMFGPICGIQIADFYLVRRQRLDMRSLYLDGPGTAYWYTGGVNLVGFLSLAAGVGTYFALLDPITFEAAGLFKYTTASLPAAAMALVVYLVLTPLLNGKRTESLAGTGRQQGTSGASVRGARG
ncbi:purine-cytosine permease family protein [Blastococcus saxobsidens]|uniref:NCS1 family nucleobase:cation symporter-1 n=1 Tax=Blastococcus saxobsidens TaxID=138336 RepID=A0A4Q7Y392_9ACTN|nr:cytosine permease [Blastococcus saxobsidens]RZU30433.1 NCS1 family nucleobase:cation symporter-1 [Blastococcus saxobsidens]